MNKQQHLQDLSTNELLQCTGGSFFEDLGRFMKELYCNMKCEAPAKTITYVGGTGFSSLW